MAYFPPTGSVVVYQLLPSSLQAGVSIIGRPPVAVTNIPSISGTVLIGNLVDISGSVVAQISGGVSSVVLVGANTVSVVGNVGQAGTIVSSLVSTVPSSVIVGTSIFGQLPAGTAVIGSVTALQGTNPWVTNIGASVATVIIGGSVATATTNSSVMLLEGANVIGSVATLQGTNPWAVTNVGSIAVQWQVPSIVGTYAEDAAHTTADKGLFILGVRNDTVASFVSADGEYAPFTVDSAGRMVIKPFADNGSTFNFTTSVVSGSVTLIKASAIGKRSYITDFWIANTNTVTSVAALVTFQDGSTSIVGRTIAPAGGGSNAPGIAIPLKTNPSQDLAFTVSPAPSILYVTVNGYQAP
jgi:hypothetical protein